ncbi:MAG: DUF4062 domain-containing protein [Spirochaetaceae bacterium]|jgi:hypothetical protein|nr:DUF4062 domain-containing protein [Spirochaetaceae bacterium]
MAKPRVFISSTFYDLRQYRQDLKQFIISMGYEPVMNEEGHIPYDKEEEIEKYCYEAIKNVDILISIVGGRYGTQSLFEGESISNHELNEARSQKKNVFIFIDKNVATEYETYLENKDNPSVKYRFVDDIKIYAFIDKLKTYKMNCDISYFETSEDIIKYLKKKWAGLFQMLLSKQELLTNKQPVAFVVMSVPVRYSPKDKKINFILYDNVTYCDGPDRANAQGSWMFPGTHIDISKEKPIQETYNNKWLIETKKCPDEIIQSCLKKKCKEWKIEASLFNIQNEVEYDDFRYIAYSPQAWQSLCPALVFRTKVYDTTACFKKDGHQIHYNLVYISSYKKVDKEYTDDSKKCEVSFKLDDFIYHGDTLAERNAEKNTHIKEIGKIISDRLGSPEILGNGTDKVLRSILEIILEVMNIFNKNPDKLKLIQDSKEE